MVATYKGTVLFGSEAVSCGFAMGIYTCSETGQNVQALAQAIIPLLGAGAGIPIPVPTPTPAPAAKSTPGGP